MNKELLQQKAEAFAKKRLMHTDDFVGYDKDMYASFLAGAKEVIDNPELYDLVKKDKYAGEESFLKENKLLKDKYNKLYEEAGGYALDIVSLMRDNRHLQKENKELKEEVKRLTKIYNDQFVSIQDKDEKIIELENRIEEIGYDALDASERE